MQAPTSQQQQQPSASRRRWTDEDENETGIYVVRQRRKLQNDPNRLPVYDSLSHFCRYSNSSSSAFSYSYRTRRSADATRCWGLMGLCQCPQHRKGPRRRGEKRSWCRLLLVAVLTAAVMTTTTATSTSGGGGGGHQQHNQGSMTASRRVTQQGPCRAVVDNRLINIEPLRRTDGKPRSVIV